MGMDAWGWALSTELNVLALVKGQERYIFVYDDESRDRLIGTFRDQAANPRLSLNWFDATILTKKAREQDPDVEPADEACHPHNRI